MRKLALYGVLLGLAAAQCWAGSVLVWEDLNLGTSAVAGAITLAGDTETLATSQSNFNTLLADGGWTAVIFAEQDTAVYADSASVLAAWVAGGGNLIGDTWESDGLAALLDGSVTSTNGSSISTTPSSPIFAGLGSTITLSNPGWGIFSQGYSTLAGGTCLGTLSSGGCAVVEGNGGHTFLNGPLNDTYSPTSEGQILIANELESFGSAAVPEPSTAALFGLGMAVLAGLGRLSRRFGK